MALSLVEASKLSNDTLKAGVIETVVSESPILRRMPFVEVLGNGITYNRENALAGAAFYGVGDTWTESTPTFTQITVALKVLGGDADIDNFLGATRGNLQDLHATIVELKAKAVARQYEDTFLYGDTAADANSFDGIHKLVASGQQVHVGSGATPAALSLTALDQMIDLVRPGKPDLLVMSRRTRRGLSKFARGASSPLTVSLGEFGQRVELYNGILIAVSDYLTDTETIASAAFAAKTGGASSSVFAVRFGEDAVAGLQASSGIEVEDLGSLETRDARRIRVKWYCNLAVFGALALARVDGISSADVVS
jgi:hypothetical protein